MATDPTISVKVDFPRQAKGDGALDFSYYTYPITMTLPRHGRDLRCERRYADFDSLRSQLCATYWYCIVPPIPEKETVQDKLQKLNPKLSSLRNKDDEHDLHEYRRTALKRFLLRVAFHPTLGGSVLLGHFLRDAEWRQCVREPVKLPDFLSVSLADSVLGKARSIGNGSNSAGGGVSVDGPGAAYSRAVAAGDATVTDPRVWDLTAEYVAQLEASLRTLRDRFHILVSRRRTAAAALSDFATAFGEVGDGEEDATLARAIATVRDHSQKLARTSSEQADEEAAKMVSTLGYYVGMCAAVSQALQYVRTGLAQTESLARRAREVEVGLPRASPANREQMQNNLRLLTERSQRLDQELGQGRQAFQAELARFHRDKQFDMRQLFKVFGELELKYAGSMKREWDELRPMIENLSA